MKDIKIYGSPFCSYCEAAKNLLLQKKIKHEYINVDSKPGLREKLSKKLNYTMIPIIFVDGEFIGGFDQLQTQVQSGKI